MEPSVLIFLVEDELITQEILQVSLEEGGYRVKMASDGLEAMKILEAENLDLSALITDISLPPGSIKGWDIAKRARELNENLPVLYMTGADGHEWVSKGVPRSVLLQKPFAPAQVVTAISRLLNEAGSTLGT